MTNRAEFERLLDVYGFRCERFGQDLSTHARAQVVSAFAAQPNAPVAGEAVAWRITHPCSPAPGWRDAAREVPPSEGEVKQQDPDLILELAYAAPQASEAVRKQALAALESAQRFIRNGVEFGYVCMPDADTPDPAHRTPGLIDAAIRALSAQPGAQKQQSRVGTNSGHGHVWTRPDGRMAKCGGPPICLDCARDRVHPDDKDGGAVYG